jgi:hypothetical protein
MLQDTFWGSSLTGLLNVTAALDISYKEKSENMSQREVKQL